MNDSRTNGSICAETDPVWTYFIQGDGAIKIGRSIHPRSRMKDLQIGSGEKLTLLLAVPYERLSEGTAHRQFKHLKIHGEWFRPEQDLLDFIEALRAENVKSKIRVPVPPKKPERSTTPIVSHLHGLRLKHGARSAIGHRCSTLDQQLEERMRYERPSWALDRRQTLDWAMEQQMNGIERLTA